MNLYDVKCPFCGIINHSLYLEETDGWMGCERCRQLTQYLRRDKQNVVPAFIVQGLSRQVSASHSGVFQEGSIVSGL